MYKKISLLVIFLLLFDMFTSCTKVKNNNQSNVTIKFATFFSEDDDELTVYKNIAKEYEKKNKGVKVQVMPSQSSDDIVKSLTQSSDFDLIGLKRTQFIDYAKSGYLAEITQSENIKNIIPKMFNICLNYGTYNGKIYGIGDMPMCFEWIYNADMFKKYGIAEPSNLNDFIEICKKLKSNGAVPLEIGALDSWVPTMIFGSITSQKADMKSIISSYGADSKAYENISGINESFNIYGKIAENCISQSNSNVNYKQSVDDFVKGKCAMISGGSWTIKQINSLKQSNFNYQVFENPVKMVDSPISTVSASGGQIIAMASNSKRQKECEKFLEYLFSSDAQKQFVDKGYISPIKDINNQGDPIQKRIVKHLSEANESSVMIVDSLKPDMAENLGRVLADILEGRVKPSEGWSRVIKQTFK